jgi:autotransporter-associated beta strand protein
MSSADPSNLVVQSGATFSYTGSALSVNRGFTIQGGGTLNPNGGDLTMSGIAAIQGVATINANGNLILSGAATASSSARLVKTGAATVSYTGSVSNQISGTGSAPGVSVVAGTLLFDGTAGNQTNHITSETWVGSTPASGGSIICSNTTMNLDSWFAVGRGTGTAGNTSSATLFNTKLSCNGVSFGYDNGIAGNYGYENVIFSGNTTVTNRGANTSNPGESVGSTVNFTIKDTAEFVTLSSGASGINGTSTVVVANSAQYIMAANSFRIGNNSTAVASMTIQDNAIFQDNGSYIDIGNAGGNGTLNMKNNGSIFTSSDFNVTDGGNGGTNYAPNNTQGTLNIQDNALVSGATFLVAKTVATVGTVNMTGGTVIARTGDTRIGGAGIGTMNQSGGLLISSNWVSIGRDSPGPGVYNLSGGTNIKVFTGANNYNVGESGIGTLNVSGTGTLLMPGSLMNIGINGTGNGTVNLNGGSITLGTIGHGTGTSTFNFNGGTLIASNANANFMSGLTAANVLAGGANINTGTNIINIGQALLNGTGGGGLTKTGNGTLRLNGTNTYTGTTTVSAGTLGGNGIIAGPVVVSAGATLSPGSSIGRLMVSNTLTLAIGSTNLMELNKTANTNDSVTGVTTLTFGGTLVLKNLSGSLAVNDTFKLFDAATYVGSFSSVVSQTLGQTVTWDVSQLAPGGNGTVKVLTAVPIPVPITPVVSGTNFNLSWPSNQTGWQLQAQTNSLATGLGTNWVTVPGSTNVNQVSFPINRAQGSVFYRLLLP